MSGYNNNGERTWIEEASRKSFEKFMDNVRNFIYISEGGTSAKHYKKVISSQLMVMLAHLTKYIYHKEKQSPSWCDSILKPVALVKDALDKGGTNVYNYFSDRDVINDLYIKGIKEESKKDPALKEFVSRKRIPELPVDYTIDNLTDNDFLCNILRTYHYSDIVTGYLINNNII